MTQKDVVKITEYSLIPLQSVALQSFNSIVHVNYSASIPNLNIEQSPVSSGSYHVFTMCHMLIDNRT